MSISKKVELTAPQIEMITIRIRGLSPLICNAFSEEKRDGILNDQVKGKKANREKKDPDSIFLDCLYPSQNGDYVFPANGLKKAAINAAHTFAEQIPKTKVRGAFYIPTEWLIIEGSKPRSRSDRVRVARGTLDIRIRAEFPEWEMSVPIQYDKNGVLTTEQIIKLFQIAGFSVGIGDWRPQCDGTFGRFEVVSNV